MSDTTFIFKKKNGIVTKFFFTIRSRQIHALLPKDVIEKKYNQEHMYIQETD